MIPDRLRRAATDEEKQDMKKPEERKHEQA
jgi:hypothetical protein